LVVAHGVAGLALVRAVALDAIPVTWAAFAALSAVVSAIRRHWAWALAGTVMALVASGVAGPAWLAVTLAGVSAASVVVALRSSGPIRSLLQATSVAAAAWAWVETIVAADWSAGQSVANSSLAFGGLALCIGALAGLGRLGRDWMGWWGGLALAGMVVAAGATAGPDGLRYVDDLRPAAGTLLFAAGSAMAARSAGWAWARWLTVGAAGWAWAEGAVGLGWSASEVVTATSLAAGTIAVLCGAGLRFRAEGSRWPLPWGALSGVGITAAGVIGAGIGSASAEPLPHVTGPLPATGVALFAVGLALSAGRFPRAGLQSLTAAAAGWAWMELAAGLDWSPRTWVPATALASGGTALVAAAGHRRGRIDRPWTLAWGGLGTIGVLAAIGSISLVERRPGALAAGGGLALLAGGAALAARPLSAPRLREVSSLLALACGAVVLYGVRPSPNTQVGAAAAAGFAAMVGSLALWRRNPDSHWLAPLALFAIAAAMASIPIAALDWPRRGPLVAALVVTGSEAAAAGFTLRRAEPLYLSPVLLCAAWLVYASEAIKGTPEPFTIPVGIALLVLVELARDDRRRHGKRPVTPELLVLEFAGMGFLVGAALVEIVATHLAYGLLAVALGGAVMAWGGVTRVRRRFAFGAVVAFVAIALMLAAPIAHNVPHFRGPALWLTVAAVGAVLITIAGLLEQGREKTKRAVRRLGELMEGWE